MNADRFTGPPEAGRAGTAAALALFDGLAPVEPGFMLGDWKGSGFPTGHPYDGLLEAYRWHGKRIEGRDRAHPLVFAVRGGRTVNLDPAFLRPLLGLLARATFLRRRAVARVLRAGIPLFATERPGARLELAHFRGVATAALIYADLPIRDLFRKLDEDRVLGLMDLEGMPQPFFFVLRRERGPAPAGCVDAPPSAAQSQPTR